MEGTVQRIFTPSLIDDRNACCLRSSLQYGFLHSLDARHHGLELTFVVFEHFGPRRVLKTAGPFVLPESWSHTSCSIQPRRMPKAVRPKRAIAAPISESVRPETGRVEPCKCDARRGLIFRPQLRRKWLQQTRCDSVVPQDLCSGTSETSMEIGIGLKAHKSNQIAQRKVDVVEVVSPTCTKGLDRMRSMVSHRREVIDLEP